MASWQWRQEAAGGEPYSPRTGHTIVEYDRCFYLFGGTDKKRRQKDLYKFDTRVNRWERLFASGEIPSRRSGAVGVASPGDGLMYVFGGYEGRDGHYFSDIHCLDLKTYVWSRIQPAAGAGGRLNKPRARTDHSLVWHDGALVVFGGFDGQNRFNDAHRFDLRTRRWRELAKSQAHDEKPTRRFGHSGVVFGDKLWVFGGWDGRETLSCVWALDLKTEQWSSLETLREALPRQVGDLVMPAAFPDEQEEEQEEQDKNENENDSENAGLAANFGFGAGGWFSFGAGTKSSNTDDKASPSGKRRRSDKKGRKKKKAAACQVRYRPMNRYRHSTVVLDKAMIVFGGVDKLHQRFNDVNRLNLDTLEWERLACDGVGPTARTFHRAVTMGDRMFVLGGYDGDNRLNDLFSVNLGPLTPAPLSQLAARYVRANVATLARQGMLDTIPPSIIEGHIWARDANGHLRGGRRLSVITDDPGAAAAAGADKQRLTRVCDKLELPPGTRSTVMCASRAASTRSSMEVDHDHGNHDDHDDNEPRCTSCGGTAAEHDLVREEDLFLYSDECKESDEREPDCEKSAELLSAAAPKYWSSTKRIIPNPSWPLA